MAGLNEAMERYARGDEAAFVGIYEAVQPRAYAFAMRRLGDRMLAEDVVQLTLLQIHRARGSYVPGADVLPWMYTIANHLVIDAMRRRQRERRLDQADFCDRLSRPATPDEETYAREAMGCLQLAYHALPESQRTVLCLRDDGLSLVEMAQLLGITVTAAKLRLHRAYKSLKTALAGGEKEIRP